VFFRVSDARYHELLREIRRLDDDLAQLRTQHERLRGRFYGARGSEQPPPPDPLTPAGKAAVLRAAGYRPGQTFKPPQE